MIVSDRVPSLPVEINDIETPFKIAKSPARLKRSEIQELEADYIKVRAYEKKCEKSFLAAVESFKLVVAEKTRILSEIAAEGESLRLTKDLENVEKKLDVYKQYINDVSKKHDEAKEFVELIEKKLPQDQKYRQNFRLSRETQAFNRARRMMKIKKRPQLSKTPTFKKGYSFDDSQDDYSYSSMEIIDGTMNFDSSHGAEVHDGTFDVSQRDGANERTFNKSQRGGVNDETFNKSLSEIVYDGTINLDSSHGEEVLGGTFDVSQIEEASNKTYNKSQRGGANKTTFNNTLDDMLYDGTVNWDSSQGEGISSNTNKTNRSLRDLVISNKKGNSNRSKLEKQLLEIESSLDKKLTLREKIIQYLARGNKKVANFYSIELKQMKKELKRIESQRNRILLKLRRIPEEQMEKHPNGEMFRHENFADYKEVLNELENFKNVRDSYEIKFQELLNDVKPGSDPEEFNKVKTIFREANEFYLDTAERNVEKLRAIADNKFHFSVRDIETAKEALKSFDDAMSKKDSTHDFSMNRTY